MNGKERSLVDVQWQLPEGWKLGLGRPGLQAFNETQEKVWVAGRMKHAEDKKIGEAVFQIVVLERPEDLDVSWIVNSINSVFQYAWKNLGPLKSRDFGIAIFPKASFPRADGMSGTQSPWIIRGWGQPTKFCTFGRSTRRPGSERVS